MHFQGNILLVFFDGRWGMVIHLAVAFAAIWLLLKFKCWYLKRRLDRERVESDWAQNVEVTEKWRGR